LNAFPALSISSKPVEAVCEQGFSRAPLQRKNTLIRRWQNTAQTPQTTCSLTQPSGRALIERRQFSGGMKGKNLRYLNEQPGAASRTVRAGFLLLEHFSLPAFTQALDTIVTANLLRAESFASQTFGLQDGEVVSDLGLVIRPDARLNCSVIKTLDLLVICGGYRTELKASEDFIHVLRTAAEQGIGLAGLWNGAWFLGRAGLLDGYRCAIHPEHRPALAEFCKVTQVSSEPYVIDRDRLTASSPSGAFHMALDWIKSLHDKALVEGIEDILAFEESRYRRIKPTENICLSAPLREVVKLMDANLEEPLELEQLAVYAGRSRRQLERLFKEQLGTTPQRYYLELRITEARRLLQHTELSQVDVLVACGFVSPSHFSKCYSSYFGYRPSKEKRLVK
jgi:transcriptional regulator GlxA family with amidase domain